MSDIKSILSKAIFDKEDIVRLLECNEDERQLLFRKATEVKEKSGVNKVYYRGLVEFSNRCKKDCFYCGIRASNKNTVRYFVEEDEIIDAIKFAYENRYASIVLQSGERSDKAFVDFVDRIIKRAKKLSDGKIGITLSTGEQTRDVYQRWFDSGAHRYLLRVESSNENLYKKLHPENSLHDFETRLNALRTIQDIGYQTGTGVMIGLPFQSTEDLANDLMFFKNFNIDMVGMGPYIEHEDTPLYEHRHALLPLQERFVLSLKMLAILRIIMPDINIAATTALQTIDPIGREKAIKIGANVIMPNLTPGKYRGDYLLYQNKPCTDEEAVDCSNCLEARIHMAGSKVGFDEWGDSKHYFKRTDSKA